MDQIQNLTREDLNFFVNQNVQIDIPYVSASGKTETLSFVCSLQYTVDNGTASESSANIKVNAPTSFGHLGPSPQRRRG